MGQATDILFSKPEDDIDTLCSQIELEKPPCGMRVGTGQPRLSGSTDVVITVNPQLMTLHSAGADAIFVTDFVTGP